MRPHYFTQYNRQSPGLRCINFLCSVLLTLILIAAIILFILWLSFRPHRPRFYLTDFSIPNINRQSGLANLLVNFNIADHNPNEKIGVYYDAVFGSVYYNDYLVGSGPVMHPLYQPPRNDTAMQGTLAATGPVPTDQIWPQFSSEVAAGSVGLRLRLNSTVRFKVKLWDTRQHHMKVDCNFKLREDGNLQDAYKNMRCSLYF